MPFSFSKENAGAFTYQKFLRGPAHSRPDPDASGAPANPWSLREIPSIARTAISTSARPVDLDRNGTLLDARGFTSIT